MPEMKDSKTSWLGSIPATWKLSRIGSLYTLRNIKVSDKDYPPLSVTMKGVVPQLETAAKTNAHDDRKLVKTGDFVINSRSDRRGSCGISPYDGSVSLINIILSPNKKMNPRYYNWLFHTVQFADEFYANGHGIVDDLWTTGWQDMKRILIPVPTLSEQEMIASFLDSKCSEIDSLTADIQKEIETLEEYKKSIITEAVTKGLNPDVEMKDSGVEWIGYIPSNWTLCKVKNVCSKIGSGTTPTSSNTEFYEDRTVNWIQSGDLYKKSTIMASASQITETALKIHKSLKVYKAPFIVIAMYGASIGNTAISKIDACVNQACCCLIPDKETYLNFLYYWIMFCKNDFLFQGQGGGQPNISKEKIKNQYFVKPSFEEQVEIASYLEKKCLEIDEIIESKKKQLDIISALKKSLIYEYVTGKKEILE